MGLRGDMLAIYFQNGSEKIICIYIDKVNVAKCKQSGSLGEGYPGVLCANLATLVTLFNNILKSRSKFKELVMMVLLKQ